MINVMNETIGSLSENLTLALKDKSEQIEISKEVLTLLAKYQLNVADVSAIFNCAMARLMKIPVDTAQAVDDNC